MATCTEDNHIFKEGWTCHCGINFSPHAEFGHNPLFPVENPSGGRMVKIGCGRLSNETIKERIRERDEEIEKTEKEYGVKINKTLLSDDPYEHNRLNEELGDVLRDYATQVDKLPKDNKLRSLFEEGNEKNVFKFCECVKDAFRDGKKEELKRLTREGKLEEFVEFVSSYESK